MGLNSVFPALIVIFNLFKLVVGDIPPQIYQLTTLGRDRVDNILVDISGIEFLSFACETSYPTKWTLDSGNIQYKLRAEAYAQLGRRTFLDFSDSSTYRYDNIIQVAQEGLKLASQVISCRHIAKWEIYASIQLMYNNETNTIFLKSVNNTVPDSSTGWGNYCPFMFHFHVMELSRSFYGGYKCEGNATPQSKYSTFVKTFARESQAELHSSKIVVRNPKCVYILPDGAKCDGCQYYLDINRSQANSVMLFCSTQQIMAGIILFLPNKKTNPKAFTVLQRPRAYLDDVIHLEYTKYPVYYVGEEVIVTLNWSKTQYYFSVGDLYLTLLKDNVQIYNELKKFTVYSNTGGDTDWTSLRYGNSTITFDKSLTTFKESGTMVLTVYVPLWNSSVWMNSSATFIVKVPAEPYFLKYVESYTFYVGEKHRSLDCNSQGGADDLLFVWNKDNGVEVVNLSSTNKSLFFEVVSISITGKYSCTVRSRVGIAKTKHFFVTVQEKDPTVTYIVILSAVLAIAILVAFSVGRFWHKNRQRIVVPLSEIENFEHGTKNTDSSQQQMISNLPYNKKFEVKRRQIKIQTSLVLGSGEFGVVYKGGLVSLETLDTAEVAVKTVKPNADVAHIKSILNELKVLSYLDNGHTNILNIFGAYTSTLRYGEVLICVELCKDSLLNTLRKTRESGTFNLANAELSFRIKPGEGNAADEDGLSVQALMSWAYQIADGMEFLHTKHVIHGDLSARNVLISMDSQVKIADFGLGRVLENYEKYFTVTEAMPLPVKWMAIETLEGKKFSSASDVWAFGVTIWEIFSLGDNPYAGIQWNPGFIQDLKNGFRLERPEFGTDQIFKLMSRCWDRNPQNRPDLGIIKREIAPYLGYTPDYLNP